MKKNVLGEKIRKLAWLKGLTQTQLAELVGYSTDSAINMIIKGKRKPSREKLMTIAKILDVPVSVLVGRKRLFSRRP
jgi:transcriptional regulator with XRE-family HTH domain